MDVKEGAYTFLNNMESFWKIQKDRFLEMKQWTDEIKNVEKQMLIVCPM